MTPLPSAVDPASTWDVAWILGVYVALLLTSGVVVSRALAFVPGDGTAPSERERDVGVIVGKCENVLTLTFVLVGAYTALAVIFAAKGIVRRDDIEKNSLYYLAGTLVNFTYSVVAGAVLLFALQVR